MRERPFLPEFEDAVLSGRKTLTSRTRRYPKGEVLQSPFGRIRILSVVRVTLGGVRDLYWREEGCESPQDFERVWKQIHPRAGFRPKQLVWLRQFEVVR